MASAHTADAEWALLFVKEKEMKGVKKHPIIDFVHKQPIGFYFEGKRYFGAEGDTLLELDMKVEKQR